MGCRCRFDATFRVEIVLQVSITEADLFGKLREANAFDLRHVHAVIFEPLGDISVLDGTSGSDKSFDSRLLDGVRT